MTEIEIDVKDIQPGDIVEVRGYATGTGWCYLTGSIGVVIEAYDNCFRFTSECPKGIWTIDRLNILRAWRKTGEIDGGRYSSPGHMWRAIEEATASDRRRHAIALIQRGITYGWRCPESVSTERLIGIAAELGLSKPEVSK